MNDIMSCLRHSLCLPLLLQCLLNLEESSCCCEIVMQKSELPNTCVQSPDREGLGALLVRVLLLPGSLSVDLCTLFAQRLLNTLEPVQRVCLPPLVEKGEAVSETHREAVLCETSALQVLLEDLLLCSSQVLNVVDGQWGEDEV